MKLKRKQPVQPSEPRLKAADVASAHEAEPREAHFDPAVEFSAEYWVSLVQEAERVLRVHTNLRVPMYAAFFSEHVPYDYEVNITDSQLGKLRKQLDTFLTANMLPEAIRQFDNLYSAQPDIRLKYVVSDRRFDMFKNYFENSLNLQTAYSYAEILYRLVIIRPDRRDELEFSDSMWGRAINELHVLQDRQQWRRFAELAKRMNLLAPEGKAKIELDESDWVGMKNELIRYKEEGPAIERLALAAAMTVLSADEAKIDDQGQIQLSEKSTTLRPEESLPDRSPIL